SQDGRCVHTACEGGASGIASQDTDDHEDFMMEIDPDIVEAFRSDLAHRSITVDFISGAWSPRFADLVCSASDVRRIKECTCRTLILASETIYSPASLAAFSETLLALLRRPNLDSKAL